MPADAPTPTRAEADERLLSPATADAFAGMFTQLAAVLHQQCRITEFPMGSSERSLEPIHKVVESEESVVIPSLAPASLLRGAECGSLNTAGLSTAMVCATRVI